MTRSEELHNQLSYFRSYIAKGWSNDTRYPKSGSEPNSSGQCAVSALIIQKIFGGYITQMIVQGVSHYFNHIDGLYCDITADQFGLDPVIVSEQCPHIGMPSYKTIKDRDTLRRAELLAKKAGFDYKFLPEIIYK